MNDNNYLITLSKFKANSFEFEVETDGISVNEANVNFIIESAAMNLMFEANNLNGKKWEVIIPPLPILQKTMYPFKITLESEGYYFEPMIGSVNVVGEGSVKVTTAPKKLAQEAKKISESIDAIDARKMSLNPKSKTSKPKVLQEKEMPTEDVVEKAIESTKQTKKKSILSEAMTEAKSNAKESKKKDEVIAGILNEMKSKSEGMIPDVGKSSVLNSLVKKGSFLS